MNLKRVIAKGDWVVLDTETTGLSRGSDICQIGVVAANGRVLMDTLICPYNRIPESATKIHGITNEMVMKSPAFPRIAGKLRKAIEGKTVLAYNASFDKRMLSQTCFLYDMKPINAWWFDVMGAYKKHSGRRRWVKLGDACKEMGVVLDGAHTAVGDALATRELVMKMTGMGVRVERK